MRVGVWNRSLRVSFREFRVTKLPSRGSWFNWDAFGLGGGISSSYLAWITGCEVLFSGSMRCTGWSNKVDDGFLHPTNANYSSSDNCVEEWRTRGSASLTQRCVKNCCSLFGRPLGGVNYLRNECEGWLIVLNCEGAVATPKNILWAHGPLTLVLI